MPHRLEAAASQRPHRLKPLGGKAPLSLREALRLNRALDRGVMHSSVGHTDAMFFQFFEKDGEVPAMTSAAVAHEVGAQLDLIGRELLEILPYSPATSPGS